MKKFIVTLALLGFMGSVGLLVYTFHQKPQPIALTATTTGPSSPAVTGDGNSIQYNGSGTVGVPGHRHLWKLKDDADLDYIFQLRKAAKERHLYWTVYCAESDGDHPFHARAAASPLDSPAVERVYVEDGAKPYWFGYGVTQQDAARDLLQRLEGEPNIHPVSRPKPPTPEHHHQCPRPITGGPQA